MTDAERATPETLQSAKQKPLDRKSRAALRNYRIAAYVVGVGLVILVFIGVPLKYFGGSDTLVAIVGPLHGFLYVAYLITVALLGLQRRWPIPRMLLVMIAGTIPLLSFVVERYVHKRVVTGVRTW